MKKKMLLILLAVALSVATIAAATMAWFTDEDSAGEATFTAGILDIDVSDGLNQLLQVATIDHLNPGDEFGEIVIDIENKGTKKLAWIGDWQFTPQGGGKLLDALYIKSMRMQMLNASDANWSEDNWYEGSYYIKDGRGVNNGYNSYQKKFYDDLADLSSFKVVTLRNFNNNKDMITLANSTWEHMGALKPGNKYRLTVEFGFHQDAENEFQGDRDGVSPIEVGFIVNATQVKADAIDNELLTGLGASINWFESQIAMQPDND